MNECTGHEGYLVGGAVRDMLLGGKPKDFDILTTATPVQVLAFPDTIFSLQRRWLFPILYTAFCSVGVSRYYIQLAARELGSSARALCNKGIPLGDTCSVCVRLPASVSTRCSIKLKCPAGKSAFWQVPNCGQQVPYSAGKLRGPDPGGFQLQHKGQAGHYSHRCRCTPQHDRPQARRELPVTAPNWLLSICAVACCVMAELIMGPGSSGLTRAC